MTILVLLLNVDGTWTFTPGIIHHLSYRLKDCKGASYLSSVSRLVAVIAGVLGYLLQTYDKTFCLVPTFYKVLNIAGLVERKTLEVLTGVLRLLV